MNSCQKLSEPVNRDNRYELCKDSGAMLIGTRFNSFEELKDCIEITYKSGVSKSVAVVHTYRNKEVSSILSNGISQNDFEKAKSATFFQKLKIGLRSPYSITRRRDLSRVLHLSRRMKHIYGEGDVAFYDLAQEMAKHIDRENLNPKYRDDFTDKGLVNTFNHLLAQAFITSIFSEKFADHIADTHELARMPELVSGKFSEAQIADLKNGPVDNYVDMINNEWGQERGTVVKKELGIKRNTEWSSKLLSEYLNHIQSYCSWSLNCSFEPFRKDDEVVIRFADKMGRVLSPNFESS